MSKRVSKVPRLKVVVRNLPYFLSPESFFSSIPEKCNSAISWKEFCPGKATEKKLIPAKAYLEFTSKEYLLEFYESYDGHPFIDSKGVEYKAIVEYAPYSRVPRAPPTDSRQGTISNDADYLAFLESLKKPTEAMPSAEVALDKKEAEERASGKKPAVQTSALLLEMWQRMSKKPERRVEKERPRDRRSRMDAKTAKGISELEQEMMASVAGRKKEDAKGKKLPSKSKTSAAAPAVILKPVDISAPISTKLTAVPTPRT